MLSLGNAEEILCEKAPKTEFVKFFAWWRHQACNRGTETNDPGKMMLKFAVFFLFRRGVFHLKCQNPI